MERRSRSDITPATGKSGCLDGSGRALNSSARDDSVRSVVTDPCDGRSQGTPAMFDSLPYRNDAATIFRRLIRSLPTRRGVLGDCHVRQGAAGDDDGARRNAAICRACSCRAA